MKILWLAHRDPLNPRAGGAERIIYEVGRRLVVKGISEGFNVTVIDDFSTYEKINLPNNIFANIHIFNISYDRIISFYYSTIIFQFLIK